jgi:hypothetical protein
MTHPLSRVPILGKFVDERFLEHRRRSSSAAGIITACLAIVLFEYRFFVNHIWSWDLLAIALVFLVIKMSMFTWYRMNG